MSPAAEGRRAWVSNGKNRPVRYPGSPKRLRGGPPALGARRLPAASAPPPIARHPVPGRPGAPARPEYRTEESIRHTARVTTKRWRDVLFTRPRKAEGQDHTKGPIFPRDTQATIQRRNPGHSMPTAVPAEVRRHASRMPERQAHDETAHRRPGLPGVDQPPRRLGQDRLDRLPAGVDDRAPGHRDRQHEAADQGDRGVEERRERGSSAARGTAWRRWRAGSSRGAARGRGASRPARARTRRRSTAGRRRAPGRR